MSKLGKAILRRWRRGGYGVHSPFAFRYITTVIAPRRDACFYEEAGLRSARERLDYRISQEARGSVAVIADDSPIPIDALAAGEIKTVVCRSATALEAIDAYARTARRGVLFRGARSAIFCARPVPRLIIDIALP